MIILTGWFFPLFSGACQSVHSYHQQKQINKQKNFYVLSNVHASHFMFLHLLKSPRKMLNNNGDMHCFLAPGVHGMQCPHLLSLPPQLEEEPSGDPIVVLHTGHCLSTVSTTFSEKGQRENNLGFVGHLLSVVSAPFGHL